MIPLALFALSACIAISPARDAVVAADLVPAWPEAAAIPGDTRLGLAPTPGVRRIFHAAELQRFAGRFEIAPPGSDICVEIAAAPLDRARMLEAMQRSVPDARIEILDSSRGAAPAGPLEFPRAGLRSVAGRGFWSGYVAYAGGRRFPIWASVDVWITATRAVAAEDLKPGTVIEARHLRLETRNEFPSATPLPDSVDELIGYSVRRTVRAGDPIRKQWLEPPHDVVRGETVRVEVSSGAARLELPGQAQASGSTGQTIPILNPLTHRRFPARIVGKGRVSVGRGDS